MSVPDRDPRDPRRARRTIRQLNAQKLTHKHVGNEIPSGAIDGANRVFTLAHLPVASSVQIFTDGVFMTQGQDYALVGKTITFDAAQVPEAGSNLRVFYIV